MTAISPELEEKLRGLEAQLALDPDSEDLREQILFEYLGKGLEGEPRRIEHIVEYVRRFPRTSIARTPYTQVRQVSHPAEFERIEHEWLRLRQEASGDPVLAIGHAGLVAPGERNRAAQILEEALEQNPDHPEVWLHLGLTYADPKRQLSALRNARALGAEHPNLLVWIARAATDAHDQQAAWQAAAALLAANRDARSRHGDKLDWQGDVWSRARQACDSDSSARELVMAIASHANRKHWAQTTLGVIAARQGNVTSALQHLRESTAIGRDFRLSSYGPALTLARELCGLGEWDAVADYFEACSTFWKPEGLDGWVRSLRERRLPELLQP